MKIKILIIIILFWENALAQINELDITIDTFNICVYGELQKSIFYEDKFYCIFATSRMNTSKDFKKMIVINQDGVFLEDVFLPEEIQDMIYYDLFIQNDSLFLKRMQFREETFSLGKYINDFKQIDKR